MGIYACCSLLVSKLKTGGVGNNVYYTFMLVNGRRVSVRSIFIGNGIGFYVLDRVYVILFLPIYLLFSSLSLSWNRSIILLTT